MSNLTKLLAGITALITAVGGLLVALRGGGESMPQPITQIIIQDVGDYQNFVQETDLAEYQQFKR
tara:strand:- start:54 stop:248 length:195 start_codon:yes stop_codon:yes gene_type:complete